VSRGAELFVCFAFSPPGVDYFFFMCVVPLLVVVVTLLAIIPGIGVTEYDDRMRAQRNSYEQRRCLRKILDRQYGDRARPKSFNSFGLCIRADECEACILRRERRQTPPIISEHPGGREQQPPSQSRAARALSATGVEK